MSDLPDGWFDALRVNPEDVARVGYGLAEYALEYEGAGVSDEDRNDALERRLMRASTLADAASLLVLVDADAAIRLFAESASLLEQVGAPEAWTLGLACRGAWEPSARLARRGDVERPSDGIASLADLFYRQERERENPHSGWEQAAGFADNPSLGWTVTGVPARLFAEFATRGREHDVDGALHVLDRVVRRADETIRLVQRQDGYHWRRFMADVPLVDPELLALATVAARLDDRVVDELRERSPTPARVALLCGMGGDADPRRRYD